MRRATLFLAAAFAAFFTCASANADVIIGDGINNGFFSDTSNPTSATGDAITTNANGRALISSSTPNDSIEIDSWSAIRRGYSGGNAAFGWDGAGGSGPSGGRTPGDIPYGFVNSGQVDFIADAVVGTFLAGDVFELDFGTYASNGSPNHTITATLDFAGGESFTFGSHAGSSTSEGITTFSDSYTLNADSTEVTLTLAVSTTSAQLAFDDVQLNVVSAVPEPATATLLGLGVLGLAGFRRRR